MYLNLVQHPFIYTSHKISTQQVLRILTNTVYQKLEMKNLMLLAVLIVLLCSINQSYGQNKKRLLGGFREVSAEDRAQEKIQNIINLGTDHVVTNSNPQLCREALSLKKIERQIFRKAHNYRITLTIQTNACPNQSTTMKTCTVIVNDVIETNVATVSRFRCK